MTSPQSRSEQLASHFSSMGLTITPTMIHSPYLGGNSGKPVPRRSGSSMENAITVANVAVVAKAMPPLPPLPPVEAVAAFVPAYVTLDRHVLRFYAYSTDAVGARLTRVRRFTILYYLVDGTLEISEPRVENSGRTQGTFLKRSAPESIGASNITPQALTVGAAVALCGRSFQVVDCDDTTRAYLASPAGGAVAAAAQIAWPSTTGEGSPDSRWSLVSAIGQPGQHDVHGVAAARSPSAQVVSFAKFAKHHGAVLCFAATFIDETPCSSIERIFCARRREFNFCFFPANDTVEITEILARPDSVSATLLGRQKLPLPAANGSPRAVGILPANPPTGPSAYVTAAHLVCGATIDVFGRAMLLESCDPFTLAWYAANLPAVAQTFVVTTTAAAPGPATVQRRRSIILTTLAAELKTALVTEVEERFSKLQDAFLAADEDRSGGFTLTELEAMCSRNHLNPAAAHDLFAACDTNGDGEIDYAEFAEMITQVKSEIDKNPGYVSATRPW